MTLDDVLSFLREHHALVEIALFLLAFAESIVLVSFLVPATLLFVAIGGLHEASGGPFLSIAAAGAAGAFLGDVISFALGRHLKGELGQRWPFRTRPGWLDEARVLLHRWGLIGIIGTKFMGPLRPIMPVVCGALRMRWSTFIVCTAIASLIWSVALLAPVYYGLRLLGS